MLTLLVSFFNDPATTEIYPLPLHDALPTFTFSQDGVARITVTDTTLTGGVPAIMAYDTPTAEKWQGTGAPRTAPSYARGRPVDNLTGKAALQENGAADVAWFANAQVSVIRA